MNNKLETISNLFEGKEIRSIWDAEKEAYYFSIAALTEANIPRNYWSDLKRQLIKEGSELHEKIVQLKLKSLKDGKMYKTDTLDTAGILRLIESVPSYKAEPFKVWLANLGKERIDEVFDPEIARQIKNSHSAHEAQKIMHENIDKVKYSNDEKVCIMEKLLRLKLEQNPYVLKKLLDTKDYTIVEDSPKDDYWGWGINRTGENQLGKLWMKLREEYKNK